MKELNTSKLAQITQHLSVQQLSNDQAIHCEQLTHENLNYVLSLIQNGTIKLAKYNKNSGALTILQQ